jgi:hypothetical protein
MNRYEMKTPRTALGIAAVAMAVLTLGAAVVLPAMTGSGGQDVLAAAKITAPPTEVAINPAHVEIVGVREQTIASAKVPPHIDMIGVRPQEIAVAGVTRAASK